MLYYLSIYLKQYWSFFNVFHYITVSSMCAMLTSLGITLIFGGKYINMAQRLFASAPREFTPDTHKAKQNMPTMGGILIIASVLGSTLLWCGLHNYKLLICLFTLVAFGAIGFIDDWCKLKNGKGISSFQKFSSQILIALVVALAWIYLDNPSTDLVFPFLKNLHPDLGYLFIPWAIFVIVGTSNAVNLTDGLDGLAMGPLITNFGVFSLISYIAGHAKIAEYLHIPFAATAEVSILGSALLGACLGFLWYNAYPAQIFMGDVGSVSLGAVLGLVALMTKQEILLVIAGGLFVLETVSVIVQVISYKYLGRRIFKMAPIHHHFELLGWPESKITTRFAIISLVLAMLAVMTLKMR